MDENPDADLDWHQIAPEARAVLLIPAGIFLIGGNAWWSFLFD
jgi:hypothetical protein